MDPKDEEVYKDDESHPIPRLNHIDVVLDIEGGAYYGIVVSQPISDDHITRARLIRKLENYVRNFKSDEFRRAHGTPLPGKLRIYVHLHSGTDPGVFSAVENCRTWLSDNNVELVVGATKSSVN